MATAYLKSPLLRFDNNKGLVLALGTLTCYAAGTTNLLTVYADAAGTTPLANPVALDAYGQATIYFQEAAYDLLLKDVNGVTQPGYPVTVNLSVVADPTIAFAVTLANTADVAKGDALVGFKRHITASIGRTVDAKFEDGLVSVKDTGAVGDGVTDDTVAIQKAIDSGRGVWFPYGTYKVSSPLMVSTTGQTITGESPHNCYLVQSAAADTLRIAGSLIRVSGIHFRPGQMSADNAYASIRIYGAQAEVDHCRFLSSRDGDGTAILCDDVNPVGGGVIAGAYAHSIRHNHFGSSGYTHKYDLFFKNLNNGHQATLVEKNNFISLNPVTVQYGGANVYRDNLVQSSVVGSGTGFDIGAQVVNELITGNYIEGFEFGVLLRQILDTYLQAKIIHNHWDNNTNQTYAIGANNFLTDSDEGGGYSNTIRGFKHLYNTANEYEVQVPNGSSALKLYSDRMLSTHLRSDTESALQWSANGSTQTPTGTLHTARGAGAAYTGCFLGPGIRNGQRLTLLGLSYSVEILKGDTVRFAEDAAGVVFGQTSGNILIMELIWVDAYGKWWEISRQVV